MLADADKEKLNGTDGGWQQETPHKKEELELARHSSDRRFEGVLMRSQGTGEIMCKNFWKAASSAYGQVSR